MPDIVYPKPYNKETHEVIADIIAYSELPNKSLATFVSEAAPNSISTFNISKGTFLEITRTYIGFQNSYFEIKLENRFLYAPAKRVSIENTVLPNFRLILENRVELVPENEFIRPTLIDVGVNRSFLDSWFKEKELIVNKSGPILYISVPLVEYNSTGTREELDEKAKQALAIGTRYILKEFGKKYSEEYIDGILFGTTSRKAFFEFAKVLQYFIDPRGADNCSYIKFLIAIPRLFVESLESLTREELISDRLGVDLEDEAQEQISRLGAGDLSSVSRFVYVRINDIKEFDDHIDLIKKVIDHYNAEQETYLEEFINSHICVSTIQALKEESELDLAAEARKFDNFKQLMREILFVNNVPVFGVNNQRDISVNKLAFGFDENYNIVYFEATRNGVSYPLIRFASDLFLRDFGNGGLNSSRSGKLFYTITLDREYTKNVSATEELRLLKETYQYEQWVNTHVVPPPLALLYPERNMKCVKNSLNKVRELAGIEVQNKQDILAVVDRYQKEKAKRENGKISIFSQQWDSFSEEVKIEQNVWLQTVRNVKDSFLQEDLKTIVMQAFACLMQRVDQNTFLQFSKDFLSTFNKLKEFLIEVFCNPTGLAIFDILTFIKIPRLDTSDPMEQLARAVEKALLELLVTLYKTIIKMFISFIESCANQPASPFDAANDLDLDNAIDQALNNAQSADSPEVSNMYDALGYPSSGSTAGSGVAEGTDGVGEQTRVRTTPEDKQKIKNFINDIACLTTTTEFCALMVSGVIPDDLKAYIDNILNVKYPEFADVLGVNGSANFSLLSNLFTKIGKALNIFDACVAINEGGPAIAAFCADPILDVKDRNTLADRNIPPDILDELLNDIKKKRQKDLEDAVQALEDKIFNEIPILCTATENGTPVKGLINAAKEDPEYATMFKDNLKHSMSEVVAVFNQELKEWKNNLIVKKSGLGDKLAKDIAKFANMTEEEKRNFVTQNELSSKEKIGDTNIFIPGKSLIPSGSNPTIPIEFIVAPTVTDSLAESNYTASSGKITLNTTADKYRDEYLSIVLTNINVASNLQTQQEINKAQKLFGEHIGAWVAGLSTRILQEALSENDKSLTDIALSISLGFGENTNPIKSNGVDSFLEFTSYFFSILESLIKSLGEYYGNYGAVERPPSAPSLPDRKILVSTDEKTKVIPQPPDKAEAPQKQQLQSGSPNKLIAPYYPPTSANEMYIGLSETILPISKYLREVQGRAGKGENILSLSFAFISSSLNTFTTLINKLREIDERVAEAYNSLATIHAAFPNYRLTHEYGLKPSGNQNILEDNRIKNYYNLIIDQTTHNVAATTGSDGNYSENSKKETTYKRFLTQTNYELIDKELSNYIKTFANLEEYKNSNEKSLQEFVFNKWRAKNNFFNYQRFTYQNILDQFIRGIRLQTSQSVFFKNEVTQDQLLSLPYLFYLDLVESTRTRAELQCGIDKNILDTDDIVNKTVDQFVNDFCNFEPPPSDGRKKRKHMNPIEKNSSNALLRATIRIYLYDYYLKGLFVLDTIRPGFVYDKLTAEFFALMMESEMRSISETYFEEFINAAQKYYDERTIKTVEDILLPENNDLFFKRSKLVELIKTEMLEVSKRLGTKIRETDISIRTDLQNKALGTNILVARQIDNLIAQNQANKDFVDNLNVGEEAEDNISISDKILNNSFTVGFPNISENLFNPDAYPIFLTPTEGSSQTDELKNPASPYALFSLLNDNEPFLTNTEFFIEGTNFERFNNHKKENFNQPLLYDQSVIINDVEKGKNLDFRLLFEFIFPLRRLYGLELAHTILANNSRPEMKRNFIGVKSKLAANHMSFMSRPNKNTLTKLPPSVAAEITADNLDILGEAKEYFKKWILKTLIETPRLIVKGSVEGGGDLNGFISSLPYTITKPLWLSFKDELPFKSRNLPLFAATPALMAGLTAVGFFFPPMLPGFLSIAYLATLGWFDEEWFTNRRKNTNQVSAAASADVLIRGLSGGDEEVDCEQVQKIIDLTVEGQKLRAIRKMDNLKEIE